MPDPRAPQLPPDPGSLVLRRVCARIVDDGLLVLGAVLIALFFLKALPSEHAGDGYGQFTGHYNGPNAKLLLTGIVAALLFAGYFGVSSRLGGATLGRRLAGIRVVDSGGDPPRASLLFGRELARLGLLGFSLALMQPVTTSLVYTVGNVTPNHFTRQLELVLGTITALVPLGLVTAAWAGVTLIDAEGRAPHDRLARTRVVRRTAAELTRFPAGTGAAAAAVPPRPAEAREPEPAATAAAPASAQ